MATTALPINYSLSHSQDRQNPSTRVYTLWGRILHLRVDIKFHSAFRGVGTAIAQYKRQSQYGPNNLKVISFFHLSTPFLTKLNWLSFFSMSPTPVWGRWQMYVVRPKWTKYFRSFATWRWSGFFLLGLKLYCFLRSKVNRFFSYLRFKIMSFLTPSLTVVMDSCMRSSNSACKKLGMTQSAIPTLPRNSYRMQSRCWMDWLARSGSWVGRYPILILLIIIYLKETGPFWPYLF